MTDVSSTKLFFFGGGGRGGVDFDDVTAKPLVESFKSLLHLGDHCPYVAFFFFAV